MVPIGKEEKKISNITTGTGTFAHKRETIPETMKASEQSQKTVSLYVIIGGEAAAISKIEKRLGKFKKGGDSAELSDEVFENLKSISKERYQIHFNQISITMTLKTASIDDTKAEVISFFKKLENDGEATIKEVSTEDTDRLYLDIAKKTKIAPVLVEVSALVNGESMEVASLYLHLREMMLTERGITVEYEQSMQDNPTARKDMILKVSTASIDEGKNILAKVLRDAFAATKSHYEKSMKYCALAHIDEGTQTPEKPEMHYSMMQHREEKDEKEQK